MLEGDIKYILRIELPKIFRTLRLFNCPNGEGTIHPHKGKPFYLVYGLIPGSSDLIGWITIGGIGYFLAIEVKTLKGKERIRQERFRKQVNEAGGIAFIARSLNEAVIKLNQEIKRRTA